MKKVLLACIMLVSSMVCGIEYNTSLNVIPSTISATFVSFDVLSSTHLWKTATGANIWNISGNVGVGDTSPDANLEILSNKGQTNYVLAVSSQNDQAGNLLCLLGNGNVGISTAAPQARLDVNGLILSTNIINNGTDLSADRVVIYSSLTTIDKWFTIYRSSINENRNWIDILKTSSTENRNFIDIALSSINVNNGLIVSTAIVRTAGTGANVWFGNTGNVGIGVTNPIGALDVLSNSQHIVVSTDGYLGIGTITPRNNIHIKSAGTAGIRFERTDLIGIFTIDTAGGFASANQMRFIDTTNGAVRMCISEVGNIGIGEITPASLFDVANKFNVLSGGNVGIGTSNPTAKLSISTTSIAGFGIEFIGAVDVLPAIGYYSGTFLKYTVDSKIYVASETIKSVDSWKPLW